MKNEQLIEFLSERPSLNIESLIKELKIDKRNFYAILNNKRKIPKAKRGKFLEILVRYGYNK